MMNIMDKEKEWTMSGQNACIIPGCIRKELVRILIERMQGGKMHGMEGPSPEPEKKSPKEIYEVEEMLNNPYMNRDEVPLAMDIFKPAVPDDTELPVIVIIHGGGLVLGDRTSSRKYGRALAGRGYLVFSIEYRLAPGVSACEQLDDVCAGMDCIGRKLVDFNVDFTRIFLTADSAGAYLAIYVAAMKNSERLQEAIGYEPTRMVFKALGLHSGMFYTDRCDPIGWLLEDQYYGKRMADSNFKQYLDPENEEIVRNLPPVFLTTSRGDFLNRYTLMYHDALKKASRKSHMVYYGSNDLPHAFVSLQPNREESIEAIDKMVDWFELQAENAKEDQKRIEAEKRALNNIQQRIESGEIIEQKSWKFIHELNSFSKDRLDTVALADGKRKFTYRQMFRMWEHYAEVFSALDITGRNHSRVMMKSNPSPEIISAMYALNMTGAAVSLAHDQFSHSVILKDLVEIENITDLILPDTGLSVRRLREIKKEQMDLGIRNIIVIHVPVHWQADAPWAERENLDNYAELRKTPGVLFMDDLLSMYEGTKICYAEDNGLEDAFIVHTSGTTSGKRKAVPVSDRGLNETARRMLVEPRLKGLRNNASTCLCMDLSIAYSMMDMLNLPLAFGSRVTTFPGENVRPELFMKMIDYRPDIVFTMSMMLEWASRMPVRPDLSFVDLVFVGGGYVSPESKKRFDKYLKECGAKTGVTIGYGNAEAGGAVILSDPDREDDSIGYPLPGVKVRLYDEDKDVFLDPADGPCRGVLHLCSPSVSCGRIDGKELFELVDIDGEKYLNTYDLVETREDGAYYFIGRMNKFFINTSGLRFDAGLTERAITAQPGVECCGIAPRFSRAVRDTVPSLYVKLTKDAGNSRETVRRALIAAFIKEELFKVSYLPFDVTIADEIPYNDGGKVDIYKITTGGVRGRRYTVVPVTEDDRLTDIKLVKFAETSSDIASLTEELRKHHDM